MKNIDKRYNPKEGEPKWQKFWEEQGIYRFQKDSNREIFSIDTPPPYVSAAHLHVGHAMSYSQAEFIVRFWRMRGKNIFYPIGFDDNGLPTERFVEKKYKINKSKIDRNEFIELCLKETQLTAENYKTLWKSLGLSLDWSLQYSTIDPRCRKVSQNSFIDLFHKGLMERKDGPILWCPACQTSLAQADIQTVELDASMYDILFKSSAGKDLIISTTRPELIPACVALYVNPNDDRYKELIGENALVPLFDHKVPIKADDSVDISFGTGLMMVCTWGDSEDVTKWREHNLDTRLAISKDGRMTDVAGKYTGMSTKKARLAIIEDLSANGLILKTEKFKHQVGVHERCDTPVEFYKSKQWFISILKAKDDFTNRGNELVWHPDFMKVRYEDWVNGLKWDWCISRSRYYGVPFPIWYCDQCDTPILADTSQLPVDPILSKPPINACPTCGNATFSGETDVMDTWMTSSCSPLINCNWPNDDSLKNDIYPMSLRVQAFEIVRTWLFYTIVKSHYHTNTLPWKQVMISGWGLDEHGKKMSKSLGNIVAPQDVIRDFSADALRFWAAGAKLGSNLRWNREDVSNGSKLLVKLWNAARFVFSNMGDFNYTDKTLKEEHLTEVDAWIVASLQNVIKKSTEAFEQCEYSEPKHAINMFFWNDFCDNYLELVKNRFWSAELYQAEIKTSTQQVLYYVFLCIIKMFAPIIPHITEELYQLYYRDAEGTISIHVSDWPEAKPHLVNDRILLVGQIITEILTMVRKHKSLGNLSIAAPLKKIVIETDEHHRSLIESSLLDIRLTLRTDEISFGNADQYSSGVLPLKISVF